MLDRDVAHWSLACSMTTNSEATLRIGSQSEIGRVTSFRLRRCGGRKRPQRVWSGGDSCRHRRRISRQVTQGHRTGDAPLRAPGPVLAAIEPLASAATGSRCRVFVVLLPSKRTLTVRLWRSRPTTPLVLGVLERSHYGNVGGARQKLSQ